MKVLSMPLFVRAILANVDTYTLMDKGKGVMCYHAKGQTIDRVIDVLDPLDCPDRLKDGGFVDCNFITWFDTTVKSCVCDSACDTVPNTYAETYIKEVTEPVGEPEFNQDPHFTNAHGQHFNLHTTGRFNMLMMTNANGTYQFGISADLVALNEKTCMPSFVRSLEVRGETGSKVIMRRGNGLEFHESLVESFEISFGNDTRWLTHSTLKESGQQPEGDLLVSAVGNHECVESTNLSLDCQSFILKANRIELLVQAGKSPNQYRHFLNMKIQRLRSDGLLVHGLLWDEVPQQVSC